MDIKLAYDSLVNKINNQILLYLAENSNGSSFTAETFEAFVIEFVNITMDYREISPNVTNEILKTSLDTIYKSLSDSILLEAEKDEYKIIYEEYVNEKREVFYSALRTLENITASNTFSYLTFETVNDLLKKCVDYAESTTAPYKLYKRLSEQEFDVMLFDNKEELLTHVSVYSKGLIMSFLEKFSEEVSYAETQKRLIIEKLYEFEEYIFRVEREYNNNVANSNLYDIIQPFLINIERFVIDLVKTYNIGSYNALFDKYQELVYRSTSLTDTIKSNALYVGTVNNIEFDITQNEFLKYIAFLEGSEDNQYYTELKSIKQLVNKLIELSIKTERDILFVKTKTITGFEERVKYRYFDTASFLQDVKQYVFMLYSGTAQESTNVTVIEHIKKIAPDEYYVYFIDRESYFDIFDSKKMFLDAIDYKNTMAEVNSIRNKLYIGLDTIRNILLKDGFITKNNIELFIIDETAAIEKIFSYLEKIQNNYVELENPSKTKAVEIILALENYKTDLNSLLDGFDKSVFFDKVTMLEDHSIIVTSLLSRSKDMFALGRFDDIGALYISDISKTYKPSILTTGNALLNKLNYFETMHKDLTNSYILSKKGDAITTPEPVYSNFFFNGEYVTVIYETHTLIKLFFNLLNTMDQNNAIFNKQKIENMKLYLDAINVICGYLTMFLTLNPFFNDSNRAIQERIVIYIEQFFDILYSIYDDLQKNISSKYANSDFNKMLREFYDTQLPILNEIKNTHASYLESVEIMSATRELHNVKNNLISEIVELTASNEIALINSYDYTTELTLSGNFPLEVNLNVSFSPDLNIESVVWESEGYDNIEGPEFRRLYTSPKEILLYCKAKNSNGVNYVKTVNISVLNRADTDSVRSLNTLIFEPLKLKNKNYATLVYFDEETKKEKAIIIDPSKKFKSDPIGTISSKSLTFDSVQITEAHKTCYFGLNSDGQNILDAFNIATNYAPTFSPDSIKNKSLIFALNFSTISDGAVNINIDNITDMAFIRKINSSVINIFEEQDLLAKSFSVNNVRVIAGDTIIIKNNYSHFALIKFDQIEITYAPDGSIDNQRIIFTTHVNLTSNSYDFAPPLTKLSPENLKFYSNDKLSFETFYNIFSEKTKVLSTLKNVMDLEKKTILEGKLYELDKILKSTALYKELDYVRAKRNSFLNKTTYRKISGLRDIVKSSPIPNINESTEFCLAMADLFGEYIYFLELYLKTFEYTIIDFDYFTESISKAKYFNNFNSMEDIKQKQMIDLVQFIRSTIISIKLIIDLMIHTDKSKIIIQPAFAILTDSGKSEDFTDLYFMFEKLYMRYGFGLQETAVDSPLDLKISEISKDILGANISEQALVSRATKIQEMEEQIIAEYDSFFKFGEWISFLNQRF